MGIAAVVALVIAVWMVLRRRRASKKSSQGTEYDGKPELHGTSVEKRAPILSEVETKEVSELPGAGKPAEMHDNATYELEGDWHGHEASKDVSSPVGPESK